MSKHDKRRARFGYGWPFGRERAWLRDLSAWMNQHEVGTHFYFDDPKLDELLQRAYRPRPASTAFDLGAWLDRPHTPESETR